MLLFYCFIVMLFAREKHPCHRSAASMPVRRDFGCGQMGKMKVAYREYPKSPCQEFAVTPLVMTPFVPFRRLLAWCGTLTLAQPIAIETALCTVLCVLVLCCAGVIIWPICLIETVLCGIERRQSPALGLGLLVVCCCFPANGLILFIRRSSQGAGEVAFIPIWPTLGFGPL